MVERGFIIAYRLIIVIAVAIVRRTAVIRCAFRCIAKLCGFLRRLDLLAKLSSQSAVIEEYEQEQENCYYERHNRTGYEAYVNHTHRSRHLFYFGYAHTHRHKRVGVRHYGECRRGKKYEYQARQPTEEDGYFQFDCVVLRAHFHQDFQDKIEPSEEREEDYVRKNLHKHSNHFNRFFVRTEFFHNHIADFRL